MSHYTALLDANVLYPAPMRDVLMQLAVTDIFKAKWSEDIHREWIDALMRHEPHRDRVALAPGLFCSALIKVRARLKNPPYSAEDYLAILTQQGLVATAAELEQFRELI